MQRTLFSPTYGKGNSRGMENVILYSLALFPTMSCLSLCIKRLAVPLHEKAPVPSEEAVIGGTLGPVSPNCAKRSSEHQSPARWSNTTPLGAKVYEKGSATLSLWQ